MRPRQIEIARVVRNWDGSMEVTFDEESKAKSAVFVMQDGGRIKFKDPKGLFQASRRVVEVSIRG
jgi:hypothetical protein